MNNFVLNLLLHDFIIHCNFKVPVPLRKTVTIDSDFILSRKLRLCYKETFMSYSLNYINRILYAFIYECFKQNRFKLFTLLVSHTDSVTDITDVTAIIAANFQ